MLRQALPGYEGQLRPQMLDEPKGIPTPEAEFPYRFGPDPLHSRPGLFPGEQAEPVQGRQVLMSKTPSPTGARTEVCYNQDWNGTAWQTVGRQTYIWDDADNIVEYLWEV